MPDYQNHLASFEAQLTEDTDALDALIAGFTPDQLQYIATAAMALAYRCELEWYMRTAPIKPNPRSLGASARRHANG